MRGKIILIEGTDCSGKETQSKLLVEKFNQMGIKSEYFSFPKYDSPTGKIIGGPFLGKKQICESYFEEGSSNVNPKVASLYYAADRLYNYSLIEKILESGTNVILDRYVYSNMAFQGAKKQDANERKEMYDFIKKLEFEFLNLPDPDIKIFLHTPIDIILKLFSKRTEAKDGNESNVCYLKNAENAYFELCELYDFIKIECSDGVEMRSIEDINNEIIHKIYSRNILDIKEKIRNGK